MVNHLTSIIQSLTQYSSNGFFIFMPFLVITRLLFASYNMESSQNIMESFKGLISVILFVSLFKLFYPLVVETGLSEVIISNINIDTPWFSNILMFTFGQIMGFFVVIVKTINISFVFFCLCLVAFSLPISFLVSRMYSFSYFWLFNKILLISVFFWLISMYLFNFFLSKNELIEISSYTTLSIELLRHLISLGVFYFSITKQISYTPNGNSLDSIQNRMLAAFSPEKYQKTIVEGLSSGKFHINENGFASDYLTSANLNRKATEEFRDKNLSEFIKKYELSSIAEADSIKKSPQSYQALSHNLSAKRSALNKVLQDKKLTNIPEANLAVENPEAFKIINDNKLGEGLITDSRMSRIIDEGKAKSISEAKNQLQFQRSSESLRKLNSKRENSLLEGLKLNSFESIGEASLYVDNRSVFDQIQINKAQNKAKTDLTLSNMIKSGQVSSIPEAKQIDLYPKAFKSQSDAFVNKQKEIDTLYSQTIKENDVDSIGEAKNFIDLPKSWKAVKYKYPKRKK